MSLYPQEREEIETEITVVEELIQKFREDQKCTDELLEVLNDLIDSLHELESK